MKSLLLVLLVSVSALAQPVVGPEMTTTPIELGDAAIGPLRDGFVAAWSDAGRIQVVGLDATLRADGAPLDLLLATSNATVTALAVATNGTSILLVWNEKRPGYAETYVATISPDIQSLLHGPVLINNTNVAPAVTVRARTYQIASGDQLFVVNEQLEKESATPIVTGSSLASTVGESGDVASVVMTSDKTCTKFDYFFGSCSYFDTFTFRSPSFARAFSVGTGYSYNPSPLLHAPIIIPYGDHFVGVLATKSITDVFEMSPSSSNREWLLDPLNNVQTLSMGSNGTDVVFVTWIAPTLNGIILRSDGTRSAPFVIAHSGYDFAKVIATSSNDFVVLYRSDDAQRSILAGRLIHLQPPRQRAIR